MNVITPGVPFYASRVRDNDPFTLVRYGEGDLRLAVPTLVAKGDDPRSRGKRDTQANAKMWAIKSARILFRRTLEDLHRSPRYFPALWHLNIMQRSNRLERIEEWLSEIGLDDVEFHDGSVWRIAVEKHQLGTMMNAIRASSLPIVVVAPKRMESIQNRLPVAKFITSPIPCGPNVVSIFVEEILAVDEPALIILSAAAAAKVLIHRLFPSIGEHSFMIDFGASLDGLCGNRVRGYHGPRQLTKAAIEKNWGTG
jgi:hypothetical protein